ncbi:type IV secretory system conjugative DNA transfer family protein [Streptomyces sp. NPDC054945]
MDPQTSADRGRRTYLVLFPHDLHRDAVLAVLRALYGPLRLSLLGSDRTVALEVYADVRGIRYYFTVAGATDGVENMLQTHLAGATVTPVDGADDVMATTPWSRVVEVGTSTAHAPLRIASSAAVTAGLLSCFTSLRNNEALGQQWIITAARPQGTPPNRMWPRRPIDEAAHKQKNAEPVFLAVGRMAARGAGARALLGRLQAHYSSLRTHGVSVKKRRFVRSATARKRLHSRAGLLAYPATLNAAELSAVIGWPFGAPQVAGLALGHSRRLAPSYSLPRQGLVIGTSNFPGDVRPLAIASEDRAAHTLIVGPTGTGKSTLLENLIESDIRSGAGLAYIDPKGDSVRRILDAVPRERLADVLLFDVTDLERPIGFNVLAGERADRVAGQLMLVFDKLFSLSINTPRAYDVLRNTLMTLAECGYTVIEVPLALLPGPRGQAFRDTLTGQLRNPELLDFWRWFDGLSSREQAETGAPITRRLRPLLLYPELRATFGQVQSGLDLAAAVAQRKIVLIPLNSAQLHEEAALVGTLCLNALWNVIQATERAENFALYVDEFRDLINLPISFGDMLAKARGHRLPITVATQDVSRLTDGMRKDVMNNARTKILFQPAASDLALLAQELGGMATAADLANLGPREIIARIYVDGVATPPVTGRTHPPPAPVGLGQAAKSASRSRYGRPRAEVEAEIDQRLRLATRRVDRTTANAPEPTPPEQIGWEEWEL